MAFHSFFLRTPSNVADTVIKPVIDSWLTSNGILDTNFKTICVSWDPLRAEYLVLCPAWRSSLGGSR